MCFVSTGLWWFWSQTESQLDGVTMLLLLLKKTSALFGQTIVQSNFPDQKFLVTLFSNYRLWLFGFRNPQLLVPVLTPIKVLQINFTPNLPTNQPTNQWKGWNYLFCQIEVCFGFSSEHFGVLTV